MTVDLKCSLPLKPFLSLQQGENDRDNFHPISGKFTSFLSFSGFEVDEASFLKQS